MKKSMKAMKAKKAMKAMKKKSMKKAMKSMKKRAMKKSVIGKKRSVFAGTKHHTASGLTKSDFKKNKQGKIVSVKKSNLGKKRFAKSIGKWAAACKAARKQLGIKGFCPVGGKTAKGQALLKKVRSLVK